jgi:CRISPR/Cas system CSM-associated protein Csm3 (group 7 of RAMP superfamily)
MTFRNPYNFVPVDEDNIPRKKDYSGHDIFSGISGSIVCRLTSKSNLITAGKNTPQQKIQYQINDQPAIQASSLKGMLRATAEAISNSCLSQMKHTNFVKDKARIESCDVNNGLCYCCRLFGTTAKKTEGQKHPFTFKGKVMLYDAIYEKGESKLDKNYLR